MPRIDAHAHICSDHPAVLDLLARLDLTCFNICVASEGNDWRGRQRDAYCDLARRHGERYRWITSFDLPDVNDPDYVDRVIADIDRDFADGAIAVKAWKNIGMAVRDAEGGFLQIDHPVLTPILDHVARSGRPMLMHLGEPLACWQALDPDNPHYGYYRNNPQWHMHGRDDHPSHGEIMAAWDRVLDRHRDLRVIGAHFGSQEYDVRAVAARMDRFPHYAVDTSARMADLAWQHPKAVTDFLTAYGDRVLFGIDHGFKDHPSDASLADAARARFLEEYEASVVEAEAYFERSGPVTVRERKVDGLGLDPSLIDRLFRANAIDWYQLQPTPARA